MAGLNKLQLGVFSQQNALDIVDPFDFQDKMLFDLKLTANAKDSGLANINGLPVYNPVETSMAYSGGYGQFNPGYIDIADSIDLSFTDGADDISAHFLFGFIWDDKTGTQYLFAKRLSLTNREYQISSDGTNFYMYFFNPTTPNAWIQLSFAVSLITVGVLNTIQLVYDGSKLHTGLSAYLNGNNPVGVTSMTGTYTGQVQGGSQLRVGNNPVSTANPFKGKGRHFAAWKGRTMTIDEIDELDRRVKNRIPIVAFDKLISPRPRMNISQGNKINPTVTFENAVIVEFYYKNISNSWVKIDDAIQVSDTTWEVLSWSPTVPPLSVKAIATFADATTEEVENVVFPISIYDTFTDVDGTSIASHTPNSLLGATAWTIDSGLWEIHTNRLKNVSAAGSSHVVYHDAGYKDVIFKFTPYIETLEVVLRYEDSNNYILLYEDGVNTVTITQRIAGVDTLLFTDTSNLISTGNIVELYCIDSEIKIVVDEVVKNFIPFTDTSGTKFGFRRNTAVSATTIDNVTIIPVAPQPIDSGVSYSATKLGSAVIPKGFNAPKDSNGFGDFDMATIGSTNYMLYSSIDNTGTFNGLCLATSDISTPHTWTPQTAYALAVTNVAGCGIYYKNGLWHVVYTDRTVGKLLYATGASLGSLTPQGVIKDLTGDRIYIRQSSIVFNRGVWYVFSDIRYDDPSGEFGYIGVFKGDSLDNLGSVKEVLSNLGYKDETFNLTGVSVKKNNGYFEMFYSGYKGREGTGFVHTIHLAISETVDGKYKRVSTDSLIEASSSFDSITSGAPCRMPNTNILYYTFNGIDTPNTGITYATLS